MPHLIWVFIGRKAWAPLVVIQIISGVALGPSVLGEILPNYYNVILNKEVIISLNSIATWAVMVFVWIAGLQLDLFKAWEKRGETSIVAALELIVPFILGMFVSIIVLKFDSLTWIGKKGNDWEDYFF